MVPWEIQGKTQRTERVKMAITWFSRAMSIGHAKEPSKNAKFEQIERKEGDEENYDHKHWNINLTVLGWITLMCL